MLSRFAVAAVLVFLALCMRSDGYLLSRITQNRVAAGAQHAAVSATCDFEVVDPVRSCLNDRTFLLNEVVEDEQFFSIVVLAATGDIIFRSTEVPNVKDTRGSWSVDPHRNVLRMVIDRTYSGRLAEYCMKSHYLGVADITRCSTGCGDGSGCSNEDGNEEDLTIIGGEVCDEMCNPVREQSSGTFLMTSVGKEHRKSWGTRFSSSSSSLSAAAAAASSSSAAVAAAAKRIANSPNSVGADLYFH